MPAADASGTLDQANANLGMTVGAVNLGNIKTVAEMASLTAGESSQQQQQSNSLASQNAVANQQNIQAIVGSSLQAHMTIMNSLSARASGFLLDTSEFARQLADLGATVASIQQDIKAGQTTPPQTGTGGAFGSDAGNALLQQLANIQATLQALADKTKTA